MAEDIPKLTLEQSTVLNHFCNFVASDIPCFILRGSAGTGKTTMIRHIAQYLEEQERSYVVLAPTGRAARVLNQKTGLDASTIHSCIYDFDKLESQVDEEGGGPKEGAGITFHFALKQNYELDTVFIIDEASMVSDVLIEQEILRFGSGKLLSDLVKYSNINVKNACTKLVFVGDYCQLPPVGMNISPALDADYLVRHHGLPSVDAVLQTVMRQSEGSAILDRATDLRKQIDRGTYNRMNVDPAEGQILPISSADAVGQASTEAKAGRWLPIIARSNRLVTEYNFSVRGQLWGVEQAPPHEGDYLLVIKNSSAYKLLNGDIVKILRADPAAEVREVHMKGKEPVTLKFRGVTILCRQPDGTLVKLDIFILENALYSSERMPSAEEIRALYVDFRQRHRHLRPGTEEFVNALRTDPYFNALLVKFGYAMTCHKAQGGEWPAVVVDFGGFSGQHNAEYFRWVYTAVTRAQKILCTVEAPCFDEFTAIRRAGVSEEVVAPQAIPPSPSDSSGDADFLRFSFPEDKLFLFDTFVKFRDAWSGAGITIETVRHLQYQEQITVRRDRSRATVQYHYKENGKMAAIGPSVLPGGGELGDEAQRLARQVLIGENASTETMRTPFLEDLELRVRNAIANSEVELRTVISLPYRERYSFTLRGQSIGVDFSYNGKQQWTGVQQVGGFTPYGAELIRSIQSELGG